MFELKSQEYVHLLIIIKVERLEHGNALRPILTEYLMLQLVLHRKINFWNNATLALGQRWQVGFLDADVSYFDGALVMLDGIDGVG